mmetsp:Transcript_25690/g.37878  ORF Transcript_25690/g.37878 Transcript_25690/m.37878 type:complete len:429 (+) Transcript_25690:203-1489(+)|eukprot:CAMPEP_0195513616 /NCGR_PEP_ID=MMETSP0794_2-20130614/5229_1 /TAXON_ID=515487 /ORGANISM="Stephanopyxis turris, Strain CCMP 815" /LENGTH=428 /DNA_ID=CAMNT_0040641673 /DNA_START=146 /DNA_END=1432 /DNA_ORIENTATION=+
MAEPITPPTSTNKPPCRFIYSPADMDQFRASSARRELLSFATALGRSCTNKSSEKGEKIADYDPSCPLVGLDPGMASLHGSLRAMESWLIDIPPEKSRARFGNAAFRKWHERLTERSAAIVNSILDCHKKHPQPDVSSSTNGDSIEAASNSGFRAAAEGDDASASAKNQEADQEEKDERKRVVEELTAYLNASFGHPIRIDYGTGHECSFLVFLYALFRIGCFGPEPGSSSCLRPVALSIFAQYLKVTRGLQTDYMLEPAGTHGVWGLDDYHCLPFYFGACQLVNNPRGISPDSIHDRDIMAEFHEQYMYFGCIRYIKFLKKGVPFFESSPMLNDISSLPSWTKVSSGLLRLFEGEVLDKFPVVQHFVFGNIFQATWSPSQKPPTAPERTFINGPFGDECIAPWANNSPTDPPSSSAVLPPTRAPWAK